MGSTQTPETVESKISYPKGSQNSKGAKKSSESVLGLSGSRWRVVPHITSKRLQRISKVVFATTDGNLKTNTLWHKLEWTTVHVVKRRNPEFQIRRTHTKDGEPNNTNSYPHWSLAILAGVHESSSLAISGGPQITHPQYTQLGQEQQAMRTEGNEMQKGIGSDDHIILEISSTCSRYIPSKLPLSQKNSQGVYVKFDWLPVSPLRQINRFAEWFLSLHRVLSHCSAVGWAQYQTPEPLRLNGSHPEHPST